MLWLDVSAVVHEGYVNLAVVEISSEADIEVQIRGLGIGSDGASGFQVNSEAGDQKLTEPGGPGMSTKEVKFLKF